MRDTCDGLIIRECDYADSDKILTVLTAEDGQITVIAKGAKSQKSKIMPLCRTFTYANLEFYQKGGRRWLSGGEIINNFFGLNSDIEGFSLAAYVLQLSGEITGEGVPCEDILRMTLNTLYAIENKLKPLSQIKSAYEIFAAEESGFSPDIHACDECGGAECEKGFWLDVMNGRIICAECQTKRSALAISAPTDELMTKNILIPIDRSTLTAWQYIREAPIKRKLAFTLKGADELKTLAKASETYLLNHLERGFDTLDFYYAIAST